MLVITKDSKVDLLKSYTTNPIVIKEILDYTRSGFTSTTKTNEPKSLPLSDELYTSTWMNYLIESKKQGVFETLKSRLVQLQFPIRKNISQTNGYKAATLRGVSINNILSATGLDLNEANSLKLQIYQSIAGKVPVLIVPNSEDFCSFVRALSYRNEPIELPESMGASLIKGLNNWDRINTYKKEWLAVNPFGNWNTEFVKNVIPNRSLYQDKIIILSKKPYSGTLSHHFGMTKEKWLSYSMKIRLEHECTHLFTFRYYGHMANNMYDELLADYMGISKVLGSFNVDWFLKFIGLEEYPRYRSGARLENYLGTYSLTEETFEILKTIIVKAAKNVADFDAHLGASYCRMDRISRLLSLCSLGLLEMSSEQSVERLVSVYKMNLDCKFSCNCHCRYES